MKQSKVPEFAPADAKVVNEIPAFAQLEQLPARMSTAHQTIELVVEKMTQLRKLLEELIDLEGLLERNQVGTDADTRALMQCMGVSLSWFLVFGCSCVSVVFWRHSSARGVPSWAVVAQDVVRVLPPFYTPLIANLRCAFIQACGQRNSQEDRSQI
jgi:hypothetical protein